MTGADPAQQAGDDRSPEGEPETLTYDQLVVTIGSTSRTLPIPGLAEHAVGLKTLSEAIALRNRLVQTLEHAESIDDDAARNSLLTYVFVGAGYAGVEGLAELQDFAADVLELYPRCRMHGVRFVLVEARDRLMPEISEGLAEFAGAELRRRGIEIRLGTTIERVSAEVDQLSTGEVIPTRTVAWTAGVKPHPIVAELGLPLDEVGRIKVDRFCQVEGYDDVWAIGDAAAVPDPARPGQPSPPTCQHAIRQGRTVGANVAAALGEGPRSRSPTRRSACSWTWAATRPSRRRSGSSGAASRVVPGPQLPPADDAGDPAPRPARRRLVGRPAVRPRLVGAGPARAPAAARGGGPLGAQRRRHAAGRRRAPRGRMRA